MRVEQYDSRGWRLTFDPWGSVETSEQQAEGVLLAVEPGGGTGSGRGGAADPVAGPLPGVATPPGAVTLAEAAPSGRLRRVSTRLGYPEPRALVVRLGVAAVIVAVSLATNRTFLIWGLFATLAVLVVPVGRARSFVLSFAPYAAIWFAFSGLRSLADETILARTLNLHVPRFERWLFGGQLPTITLQERFFDPEHLRFHDYYLTGIHWSYFLVPQVVAVWIWAKSPRLFKRYLSAMALLLAVGLGLYFLIPTNPPWLAPDTVNSPAAVQVARVMATIGEALGGGLYRASYKVIGESNPIAAMPSIHMAITFLLVFPAWSAGKRWRSLAVAYAASMALALVYLGEHYVVDIAVGMLITAYAWFAAGFWLERIVPVVGRARRREPAPAQPAQPLGGVGA
jgi:hypothetical protein